MITLLTTPRQALRLPDPACRFTTSLMGVVKGEYSWPVSRARLLSPEVTVLGRRPRQAGHRASGLRGSMLSGNSYRDLKPHQQDLSQGGASARLLPKVDLVLLLHL